MLIESKYNFFPILLGVTLGFLLPQFFELDLTELSQTAGLSPRLQPSPEYFNGRKTVAEQLHDQVKIGCLVLTSPKRHESQARHVMNTWGKRCNKLVFFSTEGARDNDTLGVVELPVKDEPRQKWRKTQETLKYTYTNLLEDVDWFFVAQDHT